MVARERQLRRLDAQLTDPNFSPAWLLDVLLQGLPFTHLGHSEVRFDCWCSEVRVLSALATLNRTEIKQIVKADEVLDIACDYCGKPYRIVPSQLRGLLDES
jgi:molecular chaperone Hsp33